MNRHTAGPDVDCCTRGTVVLFQPLTERARSWFSSWAPNLPTVCVDQASATDVHDAMQDMGFRISGSWR